MADGQLTRETSHKNMLNMNPQPGVLQHNALNAAPSDHPGRESI